MTAENLYRAPSASLVEERELPGIQLASLGQRLGAQIIDMLIFMPVLFPLMYAFGLLHFMETKEPETFLTTVLTQVLSLAVYVLINAYFLKTAGQTIGKKIVGIRIADMNNNIPPFLKLFGLRILPWSALSIIPYVGLFLAIVENLFIFRSDRRCIHDLLAGTKVVKVKKS